ncbi:MAG: SMI1/KNR4 family protein [Planctomycetales bacterium]|nr:SMI1/KNR4 family protein [Planctomycetales bacterium]
MEIPKEIAKLARKYPDLIEPGSGATATQLAELEERLGTKLPAFYRNYLRTFGVIAIGSEEFFGFVGKVGSRDFRNVVAAKTNWAKRWELPKNLIPVLDEEGDSLLCLDAATGKDDLLRWFPRSKKSVSTGQGLFPFLLQLCQEIIEDEGGEE